MSALEVLPSTFFSFKNYTFKLLLQIFLFRSSNFDAHFTHIPYLVCVNFGLRIYPIKTAYFKPVTSLLLLQYKNHLILNNHKRIVYFTLIRCVLELLLKIFDWHDKKKQKVHIKIIFKNAMMLEID